MYVVFWMSCGIPEMKQFESHQLTVALGFMETLRERDRKGEIDAKFVVFASQDPNSVGRPGVSDKLPEGYDWSKQHRGAGPRKE